MARKVKVVDDPHEAAETAFEGGLPTSFTGKRACPECDGGNARGLLAPPPEIGKEWLHLTGNERHDWKNNRLRDGRLSKNDMFGVDMPHPEDPSHHAPGGWFDTQHHSYALGSHGDKEQLVHHKAPMLPKEEVQEMLQYIEDSEAAGQFLDPEMNMKMGIGHPEHGLDPETFTHPTVSDYGRYKTAQDQVKYDKLGTEEHPHLGEMLRFMKTNPLRLEQHANQRHDAFRDHHSHLYDAMTGDEKVGKTPCSICAGHGTVTGNRAAHYFGAHPGFESVKAVKTGTGQYYTVKGKEVEYETGSGVIDPNHPNHEADRADINDKLQFDSAPFGGAWNSDDPLGEVQHRPQSEFLCPHCTGLGRCFTCSGDGQIQVADPSMSEEERAKVHNDAARWGHAMSLQATNPAQPWTRPGELPFAGDSPSFLQTEPGAGQWGLRDQYQRVPPFALPQSPAGSPAAVETSPYFGQPDKPIGRMRTSRELPPIQPYSAGEEMSFHERIRQGGYPAQESDTRQAWWPEGVPGGAREDDVLRLPGQSAGLRLPGQQETPPSTVGQIIEFPDQFDDMAHHDPNDPRGFRLTPDGKTPFEQHGMRAWDSYDDRGAIKGRFKPPAPDAKFGSGMSWSAKGGFDPTSIEQEYKDRKALIEHQFAGGGLSLPGEGKTDALRELAAEKEKDLHMGKLRRAKMVRHHAYRSPNSLWQNPPRDVLLAALSLRGEGMGTPDNAHLDNLHQLRGMPEPHDSIAAEMALFHAIRSVHPEWVPPEGVQSLMPREDYISLVNKSEPMQMAFALLKAYSFAASR